MKKLLLNSGEKVILGMIHLNGKNDEEVLNIAKNEINILMNNGINAVIIENYFGTIRNVEQVLEYLHSNKKDIIYGVNVLDDDYKGFEFSKKYNASFIQLE